GGLDDGTVQAVGDLVGEIDHHVGEAGGGQVGLVLGPGEGPGDAADVAAPLGPLGRAQAVLGDDVADAKSPAGLEHAEGLGEYRRLVDRQVDHAVGDHHVDGLGRQRDRLDVALA